MKGNSKCLQSGSSPFQKGLRLLWSLQEQEWWPQVLQSTMTQLFTWALILDNSEKQVTDLESHASHASRTEEGKSQFGPKLLAYPIHQLEGQNHPATI